MALRSVEPEHDGMRTGPARADGRAPARGKPVRTGKPWAADSGEGALHHVNVRTFWLEERGSARAREIMDPENTNRVTDDRLTSSSGQGGSTRTHNVRDSSTREHRDATPTSTVATTG